MRCSRCFLKKVGTWHKPRAPHEVITVRFESCKVDLLCIIVHCFCKIAAVQEFSILEFLSLHLDSSSVVLFRRSSTMLCHQHDWSLFGSRLNIYRSMSSLDSNFKGIVIQISLRPWTRRENWLFMSVWAKCWTDDPKNVSFTVLMMCSCNSNKQLPGKLILTKGFFVVVEFSGGK